MFLLFKKIIPQNINTQITTLPKSATEHKIYDEDEPGGKEKNDELRANFKLDDVNPLLQALQKAADDSSNSSETRCELYLSLSSTQGTVSGILRANGGLAFGKSSFQNLKLAIAQDLRSSKAASALAKTVGTMISKPMFSRKAIQFAMKINLKDEARFALKHLSELGLTNDPYYSALLKFANK